MSFYRAPDGVAAMFGGDAESEQVAFFAPPTIRSTAGARGFPARQIRRHVCNEFRRNVEAHIRSLSSNYAREMLA